VTVDLAITPDSRWSATTTELVAASAAAGFSALGVARDRVDDSVVAAYHEHGLRCHEVLALLLGAEAEATVAAANRLAEAADAIGAEWVLTIFRDALSADTANLIERCAAIFAEVGAGLAAEFSPLGPVATIRDAREIVRVGNRTGRAGVMIDSWHFSFGDSTWADLAEVPLEEIAYVQFTDAAQPESDDMARETMHRRALPGEGILELDRFATTLLDRGWNGTVSVEVLSAELRTLSADEIVKRFRDATAPYWLR
jgi:sugar phosphate isomerase/epimerase